MRSSQYCPRLKLSFWSCLRYMKERREGEKARKNMKEEAGLFPSLVLFFSSFFLLRAASLVNYLNARNGLFHVCYWSLYSNLNTPINFRAGHPRKNTIQFTALRNFTFLSLSTELNCHFKSLGKVTRETFPLTDSMRIRRFHAYWSIFILKYFLKAYASPLFIVITYCKIRNFFCIVAVLLIFHTSGSKNTIW